MSSSDYHRNLASLIAVPHKTCYQTFQKTKKTQRHLLLSPELSVLLRQVAGSRFLSFPWESLLSSLSAAKAANNQQTHSFCQGQILSLLDKSFMNSITLFPLSVRPEVMLNMGLPELFRSLY